MTPNHQLPLEPKLHPAGSIKSLGAIYQGDTVMLSKTMIALFAAASVGMLAPSAASAGGGFGGGGRSVAIGGGGFRSPAIRSAAIGSGGFRSRAFAANGFHNRGFRSGSFHHGFHHHGRRFAFGAFALGLGYPYASYDDYDYGYPYYDYANDDSDYGDGGCYVVQRRVHTRHGWRTRPVQVCGRSRGLR